MGKIRDLFNDKKCLNCYVTAGYPDMNTFKKIVMTLSDNHVDIIEIGIPFSDPIADGEVIQKSTNSVLQNHINIEKIAQAIKSIRPKIKSQLIFMSYYNPIFVYGEDKFIQLAKSSGISGIIVPDLPYDEGEKFYKLCIHNKLETIILVPPNTPMNRVKAIAKLTTGFIYFVSILGTTGVRNTIPTEIIEKLKLIRKNTDLPLCLGFGIKSKASIRPFYHYIDGVIIGSALINLISENLKSKANMLKKVSQFVLELQHGLA